MNLTSLAKAMTPEVYENLRTAVELGKWADGTPLSAEQREQSLQMVMAYQALVLQSDEHFTIGSDGQIVHKSKSELKAQFAQNTIARFTQDDL